MLIKEDVIQEIANIGSGYAAKALSDFCNKTVLHKKPKIVPVTDINDFIKIFRVNYEILASRIKFDGDLKGDASLILPTLKAFDLIKIISKNVDVKINGRIKDYFETYNEIANIITGAFFTATSELIDVNVKLDVPHSIFGPTVTVFRVMKSLLGRNIGKPICIHTRFTIEGENIQVYLFLFLEKSSASKLAGNVVKKLS